MTHASQITVLLNVEDVDRSAAFYREVFGLELDERWQYAGKTLWARLRAGSLRLMLNEHGAESPRRRERSAHLDVVLYISVPDADAVHQRLRAQGHAPGAIHDEAYGLRQFSLRDPDGYELAITSPLVKP